MSYKDGIPLLASFEDDVDEDDLSFRNIRPRKCRCSKRTIMFSVVLTLAVSLVIALIVGITVPVLVIPNTGGGIKHITKPTDESNKTESMSASTTSVQFLSTSKGTVMDTSTVIQPTVSLFVSSSLQPQMTTSTSSAFPSMSYVSSPSTVSSSPAQSQVPSTMGSFSAAPFGTSYIASSAVSISSQSQPPSPTPLSSSGVVSMMTSYEYVTSSAVPPTPSPTPLSSSGVVSMTTSYVYSTSSILFNSSQPPTPSPTPVSVEPTPSMTSTSRMMLLSSSVAINSSIAINSSSHEVISTILMPFTDYGVSSDSALTHIPSVMAQSYVMSTSSLPQPMQSPPSSTSSKLQSNTTTNV